MPRTCERKHSGLKKTMTRRCCTCGVRNNVGCRTQSLPIHFTVSDSLLYRFPAFIQVSLITKLENELQFFFLFYFKCLSFCSVPLFLCQLLFSGLLYYILVCEERCTFSHACNDSMVSWSSAGVLQGSVTPESTIKDKTLHTARAIFLHITASQLLFVRDLFFTSWAFLNTLLLAVCMSAMGHRNLLKLPYLGFVKFSFWPHVYYVAHNRTVTELFTKF